MEGEIIFVGLFDIEQLCVFPYFSRKVSSKRSEPTKNPYVTLYLYFQDRSGYPHSLKFLVIFPGVVFNVK